MLDGFDPLDDPDDPDDPGEPGGFEVPGDPLIPPLEPGFFDVPGVPLGGEALLPEFDAPSPCDELPRSRFEPLDEPEVFWSRSAILMPSRNRGRPSEPCA